MRLTTERDEVSRRSAAILAGLNRDDRSPVADGLAVFALGGYSLVQFLRKSGTAWDWPALDMAPLVARQLDASFLATDFFTNASAEPNARHVFGRLLLTVAQCLGGDWYAAMFLLKVLAVALLPALWYLVLVGWGRAWFDRRRPSGEPHATDAVVRGALSIVACVAVALAIRPKWGDQFSIAWWSPFQPQATSATYAQLFALAGSIAAAVPTRLRLGIAVLAWAIATLVHPAIGLFMLALQAIVQFDALRFRDAAAALTVCWIVPSAILALAYRSNVSLDAAEFIRHYVGRHAAHYWPAEFGTLSGKPWWRSFALVAGCMLAAALYGAFRRNLRLATLALLCAASYVGCVALQYVGVVAWPNKLLATLGPVRFSGLGYWELALLASIGVGEMVRHRTTAADGSGSAACGACNWIARWGTSGVPRSWAIGGLVCAAVYVGLVQRDDPVGRIRGENAAFYAWVDAHTAADSVFAAADSGLCVDLALAGRRAVFAGSGFPFREDFFEEHTRRHELVYGTPEDLARLPGRVRGERETAFFRTLTAADFVRIAREYRLDFVIIERPARGDALPAGLATVAPRFADKSFLVYAIDDLVRRGG
jgi:hypothetical protein